MQAKVQEHKKLLEELAITRLRIRAGPKDFLCASVQIFLNVSPKVIKLFSFFLFPFSFLLEAEDLLTNNLKEALL